MNQAERGTGPPSFDRVFLRLSLFSIVPGGIILWIIWGWRYGVAFAATTLLVTLDFLWLARGVRGMVSAKPTKISGAARRALFAFGARTLLLLVGLYAIIRLLSGVGPAIAAGICFPLITLALAGILQTRD